MIPAAVIVAIPVLLLIGVVVFFFLDRHWAEVDHDVWIVVSKYLVPGCYYPFEYYYHGDVLPDGLYSPIYYPDRWYLTLMLQRGKYTEVEVGRDLYDAVRQGEGVEVFFSRGHFTGKLRIIKVKSS